MCVCRVKAQKGRTGALVWRFINLIYELVSLVQDLDIDRAQKVGKNNPYYIHVWCWE